MRTPSSLVLAALVVASVSHVACTEQIITKKVAAAPAEAPTDEEEAPPTEAPPSETTKPTPTSGVFLDLGEAPVGQDVSFTIPAGTLGFNLTVESDVADFDPRAPFGIERITDPNGNIVHDDFTPKGGTKDTSTAAFDTIAAASVPQGDGVAEKIPAGVWKVRYGIKNGDGYKPKLRGKVRVQASSDGVFHGGKLDLHVHVPPGLVVRDSGSSRRVDAANASKDASLAKRIDTFFGLADQLLGIDRGEVVFHVADAKFADVDGTQELLDGFAISRGAKDGDQEMHVLLTNRIADQGEAFALGIAPGIPGAATIYGRNVSGIIVASGQSADEDALTMLHETGHFIGLNHTTEFDGASSDPLSDTPRCPSINGGQGMYSCPDRGNIMFPAGAIDRPVTLSTSQKRVYRGSPFYKAYASDTQKTLSAKVPVTLTMEARSFHASGRALTALESQLSLGACGLTRVDAGALVSRFGRDRAVAELRAASADDGLAPFVRGRARQALRSLGEQP